MDSFEDWMIMLNRPLRRDILTALCDPKTQPDYSSLAFLDAYPLIDHLCKERYVGFNAIHFSIEKHLNPKAYSATLVITRPDNVKLMFTAEGPYAHEKLAMHKSALLAVRSGALQFILSGPSSVVPHRLSLPVPPPPSTHFHQADADRASQAPPIPKGLLGPALREAKARGFSGKNPIAQINQAQQHVYREHGLPILKSSLKWKVVPLGPKQFVACIIVVLPSGKSRCYGDLSGSVETYVSEQEAKLAAAVLAIDTGILGFIFSERLGNPPAPAASGPPPALVSLSQLGPSPSGTVAPSIFPPPGSYPLTRKGLRTPPLYLPDFVITERGILPPRESSPPPAPVMVPNPAPPLPSTGTKRARSVDHTSNSMGQRSAPGTPLPTAVGAPAPQLGATAGSSQAPLAKKQKPDSEVSQPADSNEKAKEPKGKSSKSFSQTLIEFCDRTKRPRPLFTFGRALDAPESSNSATYDIHMFFDGVWYQIFNHHMSLEEAEELLSEYILALVGIITIGQ